jgi:hypothetical protein
MKRFIVGGLIAAALAIPAAAAADSCANVSRAAPACDMSCTSPVIDGHWIWLPSVGVPFPAWSFAPPGAADSVALGLPGVNGNYTNSQASSLLGMSVHCDPAGDPSNRQQAHGIQSGCE